MSLKTIGYNEILKLLKKYKDLYSTVIVILKDDYKLSDDEKKNLGLDIEKENVGWSESEESEERVEENEEKVERVEFGDVVEIKHYKSIKNIFMELKNTFIMGKIDDFLENMKLDLHPYIIENKNEEIRSDMKFLDEEKIAKTLGNRMEKASSFSEEEIDRNKKNIKKAVYIKKRTNVQSAVLNLTKLDKYLMTHKIDKKHAKAQNFFIPSKKTKYYFLSIDCECIMTAVGNELGRISIVNEKRELIYDKTVHPTFPVVDYVTRYSGLTKEDFEDAISFSKLHEDLKEIIGTNTILIGHTIGLDLMYIKTTHNKIIDASRIFNRTKNSLKRLSEDILGAYIQSNTHCSIEDSKRTMELVLYNHIIKYIFNYNDLLYLIEKKNQEKANGIHFIVAEHIESVESPKVKQIVIFKHKDTKLIKFL